MVITYIMGLISPLRSSAGKAKPKSKPDPAPWTGGLRDQGTSPDIRELEN